MSQGRRPGAAGLQVEPTEDSPQQQAEDDHHEHAQHGLAGVVVSLLYNACSFLSIMAQARLDQAVSPVGCELP